MKEYLIECGLRGVMLASTFICVGIMMTSILPFKMMLSFTSSPLILSFSIIVPCIMAAIIGATSMNIIESYFKSKFNIEW